MSEPENGPQSQSGGPTANFAALRDGGRDERGRFAKDNFGAIQTGERSRRLMAVPEIAALHAE